MTSRRIVDRQHIPSPVARVLSTLHENGYLSYIVGGACRDLLEGISPHDWDIATSATPDVVKNLFGATHRLITLGESHGTVRLIPRESDTSVYVEVTTLRTEGAYQDARHPDEVQFVEDIEDDLKRRDFTVNAVACKWPDLDVIDPFLGVRDLGRRLIRAVGEPLRRFGEDALRLLRAFRLVSEKGFRIERATYSGISENAHLIDVISRERIRDEFSRLMTGKHVKNALTGMLDVGLLQRILPEFSDSVGFDQRSRYHTRKLHDHVIETVAWVPPRLEVRLAALLHDIAKPRTYSLDESKGAHYYGHAREGAEIASSILKRLRYDSDTVARVSLLVREHMFAYGPEVSDAGVRRLVGRVGRENLADLFELRRADIIAAGGLPDPLLDGMWDRVVVCVTGEEPTGYLDLAVNGTDVMQVTGWKPGPKVGRMLELLLEEVIQDPSLNARDRLLDLVSNLKDKIQ